MTARALATITVVVLTLAGCGGKSSSTIAADRAVAYMRALIAGDGQTACPMLTAKAKRTLFGTGANCESQMQALRSQMSRDQVTLIRKALDHGVKGNASGNDASVYITLDTGATETLILKKSGGAWYIDGSS